MRFLKSVIIGMAIFSMTMALSGLARAEMGAGMGCNGMKENKWSAEDSAAQIKTLRDSAAALQTSNPTLAKGLNDLADKKADMVKKWQERKDKHTMKMNLLKDSSAALKTANPALSQELQKMSDESGEMMEPKQ